MIEWRGLLDSIRVPWKDKGPNTTRGNVNIPCPFCGNDPSYHLSIAEERLAFYCYRDTRHAGSGGPAIVGLLMRLGQSREQAQLLVKRWEQLPGRPANQAAQIIRRGDLVDEWEGFFPAADHGGCLDYLIRRGFSSPERVAARYNLRVAQNGTWARRLLIPYAIGDTLFSWAGRALSPRLTPKYLIQKGPDDGLIYLPTEPERILLIVEGQIDALKITHAMEGTGVTALALTGKALPPARLLRLRSVVAGASKTFLSLDNDVKTGERLSILSEINGAVTKPLTRYPLPSFYKDAGEMPLKDIRSWLGRALAVA